MSGTDVQNGPTVLPAWYGATSGGRAPVLSGTKQVQHFPYRPTRSHEIPSTDVSGMLLAGTKDSTAGGAGTLSAVPKEDGSVLSEVRFWRTYMVPNLPVVLHRYSDPTPPYAMPGTDPA